MIRPACCRNSCFTRCSARRALGELSQVWSEVSAAAGAAGRIAEILAIAPRIAAPPHPAAAAVARPRARSGSRIVDFAYPTRRGQPVLHGLILLGARPARPSRSWGRPAPARRPSSSCSCDSTIPPQGRILLDGVPIETPRSRRSARRSWRWCPQDAGGVFGDGRRQHPLRARRRRPMRLSPRRRARPRPHGFVDGPAGRLRDASRRTRRDAFGRPAPAPRPRARHPEGRARAAARRGDLRSRCGKRAAGPGRARRA